MIYEGTNDLSHDTREAAKAQGLPGTDLIGTSWMSQHSVAWELIEKNLRAARPAADTGAPTLQLDVDALISQFRGDLTAEVQAARRVARTVVLLSFAHQQRREQSHDAQRAAATTSLLWMPYMSLDGVPRRFRRLQPRDPRGRRRGGLRAGRGRGLDPRRRRALRGLGALHDAGCRLQADRVLAALTGSPQFQWPEMRIAP